jgi:hypothetical protein
MTKQDLSFFIPFVLAAFLFSIPCYFAWRIQSAEDVRRQAIHRGLATYDEKGEFQWIKK